MTLTPLYCSKCGREITEHFVLQWNNGEQIVLCPQCAYKDNRLPNVTVNIRICPCPMYEVIHYE